MAQPQHQPAGHNDHPAIGYRPPRYLTWIRWALGALSLFLVLTIAYVGLWFYMAVATQNFIALWAQERRDAGYQIAYDRLEVGGFPGPIGVNITNPTIGAPISNGIAAWAWQSKGLVVRIYPLSLPLFTIRATIDAAGDHQLSLNGKSGIRIFDGAAEQFRISGSAQYGQTPNSAKVEIKNLALVDAPSGDRISATQVRATLTRHNTPPTDLTVPNATATIVLSGVRLPDAYRSPLGSEIAAVNLRLQLLGGIPAGPLADGLALWRDAGGTVNIPSARIVHGTLALSGSGTLALDGTLQPVGSFDSRTTGFFGALDQLRAAQVVTSGDVAMAKIVLGAMARRREKNGPLVLSLTTSARNQTLYAGPVAVARLPQVKWGTGSFVGTQDR